jgi:hypothetical protein
VILDFQLHRDQPDAATHRRQAKIAIAAMKATIAELSGDDDKTGKAGTHSTFMPHDLLLEQLVDSRIKQLRARQRWADQLMDALHAIANFPLTATLEEHKGRPVGDDVALEIAGAVRAYMLMHEGSDFCTRQVRTDGTRIIRNPLAVTMLGQVFAAIGMLPRLTIRTIVRRVYDEEVGADEAAGPTVLPRSLEG